MALGFQDWMSAAETDSPLIDQRTERPYRFPETGHDVANGHFCEECLKIIVPDMIAAGIIQMEDGQPKLLQQ